MASIESNKTTPPTVWWVKWREGGRKGRATTKTCYQEAQALKLKALVDEAGNRMPQRKILEAYGLEWVLDDGPPTQTAAAAATPGLVTVSDLVGRYLTFKQDSPRPPSERTLNDYRQYKRDHVDGHWFGALAADDADQDHARRWQAEIAQKDGYSAESAMKVRTSLVAPAFKWAKITTKKAQIPIRTWSSPFEGLPMLETIVQRRDRLESLDEIHAMIECAYEIDPNWADLVVTKLCSASRYGEITMPTVAGVKPRGIELVERQSAGKVLRGTKAGINIWRFAPLPALNMEIISLRTQLFGPAALIFWGPLGNRWTYQPYWRRWHTLEDKIRQRGIHKHLTGHCMRITCNSALGAAGVHPEVQRLMTGHAKPGEHKNMTGHYTGWTDPMMDAVLEVTTPWLELPIIKKRIQQLRDGAVIAGTVNLRPKPIGNSHHPRH